MLYSPETIETAQAIQNLNTSFALLGLVLIFGLVVYSKVRTGKSSSGSGGGGMKLLFARFFAFCYAVLRSLSGMLREVIGQQHQLIVARLEARNELRRANESESQSNSDILPAYAGNYTPISVFGKPWEHYEEPAFTRKGVQLRF
ncbi:hypothetical protein [Halomonas sp. I5-271120]|uniref:hypothetical protein n=1 Tax=Halomonas sp. I5-271120 TaxID=3061632 RepID=UPI002714D186|nr:hypothetical protein [Halomonas sp. I5-271120]